MRVTQKMMAESMQFWLARRAAALYEAETVSSTSKKVNQPSDDPLASGRILADRTTLSSLGQYLSNAEQAQSWIEVSETVLESVYDLLDEARDIAIDQSAGDLTDREELAQTLDNSLAQIVDQANTKYGGTYLFSGDKSEAQPFSNEAAISGGTAEDLVFDLAGEAAEVEITITDGSGNVVRTISLSSGDEGTNTVSWDGLDDDGQALPDGDYEFSVKAADSSGAPTAASPTYRGDSGDKEIMVGDSTAISINTDGGSLFGDAIMAVSRAAAALNAETHDSADLDAAVGDLDAAMADLKKAMVDMSLVSGRLTATADRLELSLDTYESRISALETADATEASINLETLETAYEVTMQTASQILGLTNLISLI
ncbi:MAG: flagellar hook-associated protein FlgL [Pseudomonadota bacterium]